MPANSPIAIRRSVSGDYPQIPMDEFTGSPTGRKPGCQRIVYQLPINIKPGLIGRSGTETVSPIFNCLPFWFQLG